MAFILRNSKLQLPSSTIVNGTADAMISRVGLMPPPYEAWCSAREGSLCCCEVGRLFLYTLRSLVQNQL